MGAWWIIWIKDPDLTLEKATDIARLNKLSQQQLKTMNSSAANTTTQSAHAVSKRQSKPVSTHCRWKTASWDVNDPTIDSITKEHEKIEQAYADVELGNERHELNFTEDMGAQANIPANTYHQTFGSVPINPLDTKLLVFGGHSPKTKAGTVQTEDSFCKILTKPVQSPPWVYVHVWTYIYSD